MDRIAKVRPSLLLWLVGIALLSGVAPAAAQGRRSCLAPTGDDDTAALQAALDRCSGARRPCTVTLCAGTFHTGILRVRDFRGTLRGRGPRRTVLRALPDLEVSKGFPDFFRADPFDPTQPWPYLVQFIDGRAHVEDLGILIPVPPPGSEGPTTGWYLLGEGPFSELRGALLFTGSRPVDFEVNDVRVEAEDPGSYLGTTAFHGVELGGLLYDESDHGDFPVFPVRGRLQVADSELDGVLIGTPLSELAEASVLLARNRYRSTIAVEVIDADRSQIAIRANRWVVSYRGVQVRQNLDGAPSQASALVVDTNRGRVAPLYAEFGDGLSFQDPGGTASLDPGATTLRVTRNRWRLGSDGKAAISGISVNGAARLRLLDNSLAGAAGAGLEVDTTTGCRISGNLLQDLDTGAGPDLHLGSGTSDCLAVVAPADVVVDEGSANTIVRQ
jgi:hypothetical protein